LSALANAEPLWPPRRLARCYWNLNRYSEARREFQIALELSAAPREATYLRWCIQAIENEPERNRHRDAIAAALELNARASHANSLAQAGNVAEAVAEVIELTKNTNRDAGQWYDFACVCAIASARVEDKRKKYADRAVELLKEAVKQGWDKLRHMAKDPDLDPIRDRQDF
jgi:tetratricopeptide (TPR) repeat protein